MTTEQEMGFGLWQIEDGEGVRREIRDLKRFRDTIGDALLIGFAQLFNVTGRLDALHTLMAQTAVALPPIVEGDQSSAQHPESVAASRNRVLVGMFIWGVLHELNVAVETLQGAGLTDVLRSRKDSVALAAWKRLRDAGLRWRRELETDARNQLAFHVGDAEVMQAGLEKWPTETPLVISTSDCSSRAATQFQIGLDLLLRGLGFTDETFSTKLVRLSGESDPAKISYVNLPSCAPLR